jgi:hypothetical protein
VPRATGRPSLRVLELISLGALILVWAVVALTWHELPAQIPRHFGLNGEPDGWGSRPTFLVLPAVALLTYLTRAPRRAPSVTREFLAVLRAVVLLGIAWATVGGVRIAGGRADGLGGWLVPCLFLAIVTTGVWFGLRSKKSRSGSAA